MIEDLFSRIAAEATSAKETARTRREAEEAERAKREAWEAAAQAVVDACRSDRNADGFAARADEAFQRFAELVDPADLDGVAEAPQQALADSDDGDPLSRMHRKDWRAELCVVALLQEAGASRLSGARLAECLICPEALAEAASSVRDDLRKQGGRAEEDFLLSTLELDLLVPGDRRAAIQKALGKPGAPTPAERRGGRAGNLYSYMAARAWLVDLHDWAKSLPASPAEAKRLLSERKPKKEDK